jgi:excisionase family DNA binding protein
MKNSHKTLLWSVEETAAALAISPWTVRLYIRQRKLCAVRVGRRVLLEPAECYEFLKSCKRQQRKEAGK